MSDVIIRPADLADALAISQLCRRAIEHSNAADYPVNEIRLICQDFSFERIGIDIQQRQVFVALSNATIVGTASYVKERLHALFIDPAWSRRGLGTRLVQHVEACARRNGDLQIEVSSSLTAVPLYERLGYTKDVFEIRDYGSTWKMTKRLE